MFEKINETNNGKNIHERNLRQEFIDAFEGYGVCNGFAQTYKLLLEKVGIFSYCIVCMVKNGNSFVGHQLNLVYGEDESSYSLDDVTYGIIKGTKNDYFDYDLDEANLKEELQGLKPIYDNQIWVILEEEYLDYIFGRNGNKLAKLMDEKNMEITKNTDFSSYGINIVSIKNINMNKKVI